VAQLIEVFKFGYFVSFVVEEGGEELSVQYRAEHVWEDKDHIWHLAPAAKPVHVLRRPTSHRRQKLSDDFIAAISAASSR
jgi:hypothetical protein